MKTERATVATTAGPKITELRRLITLNDLLNKMKELLHEHKQFRAGQDRAVVTKTKKLETLIEYFDRRNRERAAVTKTDAP